MKILFVGPNVGTAQHRIQALTRLGHTVYNVDPDSFLPNNPILTKLQWETGGLLLRRQIATSLLDAVKRFSFEFTWVDGGRYVQPEVVQHLKRHGPVINYVNDDPFGKRDRYAWLLYRKAVPFYDLIAVRREQNIEEGYRYGARKMLFRFLTADEVAHAPRALTAEDHARWDSDVLFVGTWMPERGPFMVELIRRGVPLTIYGDHWRKSREWPLLQQAWKGPGTTHPDDYAKAIQCARICLGLLSKGNRDLHTRRSMEVPALGGLLCAERTTEHEHLYRDGEEAVFWRDAADCADLCQSLLNDEPRRSEIARRGHLRCRQNGHYNEPCLAGILAEATCG